MTIKTSTPGSTTLRSAAVIAGLLTLAGAIAYVIAMLPGATGDYGVHMAVDGDNAGPAIHALTRLDFAGVIQHQPLMGLASLLVRAPLAALAPVLGGDDRLAYRLGALVCLLPACLLGAWLVRDGRSLSWRAGAGAIAAVCMIAGPATRSAIAVGHPEEVMAAVLATAAVLAAVRGHVNLAAITLGCAVGTKQWALIAAAPVLLALDGRRWSTALKSAGIAVVLCAALPFADPAAFRGASHAVGGVRWADPFSIWWALGPRLSGTGVGGIVSHDLPLGLTRTAALELLAVLAASCLWLGLRSQPGRVARGLDPLALLTLAGLLRCIADPTPLEYNFADLVIPLAAWETARLRRLPVLTVAACAAIGVLMPLDTFKHLDSDVVNVLTLAWTLPLAAYLTAMGLGLDVHPRRPAASAFA